MKKEEKKQRKRKPAPVTQEKTPDGRWRLSIKTDDFYGIIDDAKEERAKKKPKK